MAPILVGALEELKPEGLYFAGTYNVLMTRGKTGKQSKHFDFNFAYHNLSRCKIPFSLIFAIDTVYLLIVLYDGSTVQVVVPAGCYIKFYGYVRHAGGTSRHDGEIYRIHVYCITDISHQPNDEVWHYTCDYKGGH
jgi:hypothetical protein